MLPSKLDENRLERELIKSLGISSERKGGLRQFEKPRKSREKNVLYYIIVRFGIFEWVQKFLFCKSSS